MTAADRLFIIIVVLCLIAAQQPEPAVQAYAIGLLFVIGLGAALTYIFGGSKHR